MQIEVRLLARLFRVPLLRLDGFVVLRDEEPPPLVVSSTASTSAAQELLPSRRAVSGRHDRHTGRDLAEAEAILSDLER